MGALLKQIVVDETVLDEAVTRMVLKRRSYIPYEVVKPDAVEERLGQVSLAQGKRILFITRQKGEMVKPCPGTLPPYLCCRYTVINQMTHCPLDCTYCILQSYLEQPFITLCANLSDVFGSIDRLLADQPGRFFRFGTGELTDSLALDELTGLSEDFVRFFSTQRNCLIELKTKTDRVDRLLESSAKNIVVSWSLNPQAIVDDEEWGAASVKKRLEAARTCQEKGFLLGFHFDPILLVPEWKPLYWELIQQIFSYVDGSRIAWISLGTLRYPPRLREIIQSRFPESRIVYEEMIRGLDGKMRYPKPLRVEMYRWVFAWLKENAPDIFVYFCMESPEVWDRVMGMHPESNEELDSWFAESLHRRFPELDMDKPEREVYAPSDSDHHSQSVKHSHQ